jgi:ParB family chromosome partitioning protein
MTTVLKQEVPEQADTERIVNLPLNRVHPHDSQPRKYFDILTQNRLADSIATYGLLQPILVKSLGQDYEIINGERRYRACLKLRLKTIKAIVREPSEDEAADLRLVENVDRKNLTDIELAWEFQRRVDKKQTHEQIAKVIGKTRTYVTQRLALLKLSKTLQMRLLRGNLSFSNARALLSIKDSKEREEVAKQVNENITTKEAILLTKKDAVTRVTLADIEKDAERSASELREGLKGIAQTVSDELTFPFPDCHCDKCGHTRDCY